MSTADTFFLLGLLVIFLAILVGVVLSVVGV